MPIIILLLKNIFVNYFIIVLISIYQHLIYRDSNFSYLDLFRFE